jgi:hypothetical protein
MHSCTTPTLPRYLRPLSTRARLGTQTARLNTPWRRRYSGFHRRLHAIPQPRSRGHPPLGSRTLLHICARRDIAQFTPRLLARSRRRSALLGLPCLSGSCMYLAEFYMPVAPCDVGRRLASSCEQPGVGSVAEQLPRDPIRAKASRQVQWGKPIRAKLVSGNPAWQSIATKDVRSVLLVDGFSRAARSASAVAEATASSALTVLTCAPRTATGNAAALAAAAPDCSASSSAVTTSASPCAAAHRIVSWLGRTFNASKRLTPCKNPCSAAASSGVRCAV